MKLNKLIEVLKDVRKRCDAGDMEVIVLSKYEEKGEKFLRFLPPVYIGPMKGPEGHVVGICADPELARMLITAKTELAKELGLESAIIDIKH